MSTTHVTQMPYPQDVKATGFGPGNRSIPPAWVQSSATTPHGWRRDQNWCQFIFSCEADAEDVGPTRCSIAWPSLPSTPRPRTVGQFATSRAPTSTRLRVARHTLVRERRRLPRSSFVPLGERAQQGREAVKKKLAPFVPFCPAALRDFRARQRIHRSDRTDRTDRTDRLRPLRDGYRCRRDRLHNARTAHP